MKTLVHKHKKRAEYYKERVNIHAHTSVPWQQLILNDFLNDIGRMENGTCLDVGMGIGNNLCTIVRFVSKIEAFDISPKVVEAVKKSPENTDLPLHVVCADAEQMPYPDDSFDLVICTEVLEHCLAPDAVIYECARVTKPGGYAIFSVPNYLNPAGGVKKFYDSFHERKTWDAWGNHESGIENFTTSRWLNKLLNASGFAIEEKRGGDLIRSWLPFFRRFYAFIDRHPFLSATKRWPLNACTMNYFCLAKKQEVNSPR
jgi:2-polyprenyl-3-methyl-5-hydroxy-6-metoxy-1,4-benzoquinol methylase